MPAGQRYQCRCGATRTLPESPTSAPETVQAACPDCGQLRRLYALGSTHHASLVEQGVFDR